MARITLESESRSKIGKLNSLRRSGYIPGVIYNQKGNSRSIQVQANVVEKFLGLLKGTPLIDISIDGKTKSIALLKEIQTDKRTNLPSHLSLLELDANKKAVFDVDIRISGESPAIKNSLGLLLISLKQIELRGLPGNIPSEIEVDISSLHEIGDTIVVSDISIPDELEFVHEDDKKLPIVAIQAFQKEEEVAVPAEAEEVTEETAETGEEAEGAETAGGEEPGGSEEPEER